MNPERRFLLNLLLAAAVVLLPASPLSAKDKKKGEAGVEQLIWKDPGVVERLDFVGGPGGRAGEPKPPFQFIEEDDSGTSPKVKVKDARGAVWSVKWGEEVHSEPFAARLAWAAGYFVEPIHFVANGTIVGAHDLKRAKDLIGADGSFTDARFQLRDPNIRFLQKKDDWKWNQNPFLGTRELNGLKIVMMLTSNWDNKDARDSARGSNTGVLQDTVQGRTRMRYVVADWGGSMGKWGSVIEREKWDSEGYASQSADFIKKVEGETIKWGYHGQHTGDATDGVGVSDVKWILRYVGRITDAQLRAGLEASGATPAEVNVFTAAIRARINQMKGAAGMLPPPKAAASAQR